MFGQARPLAAILTLAMLAFGSCREDVVTPGLEDASVDDAKQGGLCSPCQRTADCLPPLRCLGYRCVASIEDSRCISLFDASAVENFPAADTPDCENSCSPAGQTKCQDEGVVTCFDDNGDGCLEWAGYQPCPDGTTCDQGQCRCMPSCSGKECGEDGCGGTCGACESGRPFCLDGLCVACLTDTDCDDSNPCTLDECDPLSGCTHVSQAVQEVCGNGLDDDCDGLVDEVNDCAIDVPPAMPGKAQEWPSVAAIADGFVICWHEWVSYQSNNYQSEVWCRLYSVTGALKTPAFRVSNGAAPVELYSCEFKTAEGFVVAWIECTSLFEPDEQCGVFARAFEADGVPKGPPVHLDPGLKPWCCGVRCTQTPSGGLIAWAGTTNPDSWPKVYVRALKPDASPIAGLTLIGKGDGWQPTVAWLGTGKGVVAFMGRCEDDPLEMCMYFQFVTSSGSTIGNLTLASATEAAEEGYPALAATQDAFLIAWRQDPFYGQNLVVRKFTANGAAGPQMFLGPKVNGDPDGPAATGIEDGRFLVAWWYGGGGLHARVLEPDLVDGGFETVVTPSGDAWNPAVAQVTPNLAVVVFEAGGLKARFLDLEGP